MFRTESCNLKRREHTYNLHIHQIHPPHDTGVNSEIDSETTNNTLTNDPISNSPINEEAQNDHVEEERSPKLVTGNDSPELRSGSLRNNSKQLEPVYYDNATDSEEDNEEFQEESVSDGEN